MAGIDRLAEVMGWDDDLDQVSKDRLCEEAASEILRLRAALSNARAEERERCARMAEDFEAQVRNNITKTVDMQGDFGAIYAAKRIAATIRGLNE